MDLEDSGVIHRPRMDSIKGFLLYVTSTYMDMIPYLKVLSLMLYSWRPYIDKDGWRLRGDSLRCTNFTENGRVWRN